MGIVVGELKPSIPVSDQGLILDWLLSKLNSFAGLPVTTELNFLDTTGDCACIRVSDKSNKLESYIDGSYTGQLEFLFVLRYKSLATSDERITALDIVNNVGAYLGSIKENFSGVFINSIEQTSNASVIYRDASGIEDNGATFVLLFEKI